MRETLTYQTDPGHGWLEVPHDDLTALGIAHKISACSYQDEAKAYLEEDVDAGVYLRAARAAGWQVETRDRYVGGNSFVQHLPNYGS